MKLGNVLHRTFKFTYAVLPYQHSPLEIFRSRVDKNWNTETDSIFLRYQNYIYCRDRKFVTNSQRAHSVHKLCLRLEARNWNKYR